VTAAWVIIGLLVLGVPLLAWWIAGRPVWGRLRPGAEADPWRDAMRRYRLTPQDTAKVESAVGWGRRLDDPSLRPAAVAWAQSVLDQQAARRARRPLWVRVIGTALILIALGVAVAWQVGGDDEFPWGVIVYWLLSGLLGYWTASAPRRAIRLNSDGAVSPRSR